MGKTCAICGEPLDGGVVVHPECVPKWISVEDKEPEKEGNYLVVYKGETKLAHWSGRGGSTWPTGDLFDVLVQDGRYHADTFGVTHWMPLPQPPKGA